MCGIKNVKKYLPHENPAAEYDMLYRLGIFFAVVAMVWVIYDILVYQKRMKDLQKILWIAGAIVFSLLTAILYFIFIKKGKF